MLHIVLFLLKIIGIILASILGLLILLILVVLLVPIRYRIDADIKKEIRAEAKIGWLLRIIYLCVLYTDNRLILRLRLFGRIFYDSGNPKNKKQNHKSGRRNKFPGSVEKSAAEAEAETEIDKIQKDMKAAETKGLQDGAEAAEIFKARGDIKTDGNFQIQKSSIESEDMEKDFQSEEKKGIFSSIKTFFHKGKEFFVRLISWFQEFKKRICSLKEKILRINKKWNTIKSFLKEDVNKKALYKSFTAIRRMLKHLRPVKLRLELEFGTGDPCSTGQILGVLAALYGYYGSSMEVIPNFEEEILQGDLFCIGRIRLFTLLIICIQLILDKNFRNLLKNFKALKEDL